SGKLLRMLGNATKRIVASNSAIKTARLVQPSVRQAPGGTTSFCEWFTSAPSHLSNRILCPHAKPTVHCEYRRSSAVDCPPPQSGRRAFRAQSFQDPCGGGFWQGE